MPYEIKYTDFVNKGSIIVEDNTINTQTSLSIPGRQRKDYGQVIGENFLQLLENFASTQPPREPIEGQLWYDTTDGIDQLKIYDGTTWTAAGGIKRSTSQPAVSNSIVGDLWVNTATQQLYLFSGSGWVLVGPEFSDGLLTGTQAQTIVGIDDAEYTVLVVKIQDVTVAIFSPSKFTPKSNIIGFPNGLNPGINLSGSVTSGNLPFKYTGVSEKSESLIINNEVVPSANFLRSDQESSTNHKLNIKSNSGISIGDNGQLTLDISSGVGVIQNNVSGSSIDFRLRSGNRFNSVVRIDSNQRVGINTLSPEQDLEVSGNILVTPKSGLSSSGFLQIDSTIESIGLDSGSFITNGGAAISLNCNIGGNLSVSGNIQTSDLIPDSSSIRNIGTSARKYNQVHATTFIGKLQGDVTGSVTGRSSSADKLTSATTFSLSGDVVPVSFAFDGQTGGTSKTFNVQISNSFVTNKTRTFDAGDNDEILLNKTSGNTGLYKISKQNFLKTLPLNPPGIIIAYGGNTAPVGWLLCDGSEVLKTDYPLLWETIGHNFKDAILLSDSGVNTFALPDFRGRFALGLDNMGGTSANTVTDSAADSIGGISGNQDITIEADNLPEHSHDLRSSDNKQYYAIGTSDSNEAASLSIGGTNTVYGFPNSGGLTNGSTAGDPINAMNPFVAINYIIYTGQ